MQRQSRQIEKQGQGSREKLKNKKTPNNMEEGKRKIKKLWRKKVRDRIKYMKRKRQ